MTMAALPIDDSHLSQIFGALANTARRSMLERLTQGAATVNELAEPFDLSLPAVSKHLSVLESAGLIVKGRRAQYRPCVIAPAPLEAVATWAEQYRPIWEARFDQMETHLNHLRQHSAKPLDNKEENPNYEQ